MPDDPIVQRNCSLIRMVEDRIHLARQNIGPLIAALLGSLKAR